MAASQQRRWVEALAENAPTVVFFALFATVDDLRIIGWATCFAALAIVTAYLLRWVSANTILLGINVYLLAITPLIETLLLLGHEASARLLIDIVQPLMFTSIFTTGVVLTAVSKRGFIGLEVSSRRGSIMYSAMLLAVSCAAMIWPFAIEGDRIVQMGLPLIALFGAQRLLIARLQDRDMGAAPPMAAVAVISEPASEAIA